MSVAALIAAITLRASRQAPFSVLETRSQQGFVLFGDSTVTVWQMVSASLSLWGRFALAWLVPEALFVVALVLVAAVFRPSPAALDAQPAPRVPARAFPWLVAGGGAVVLMAVSLWVGARVPYAGDEFSYLFGARLLTQGAFAAPAPSFAEHYACNNIICGERWFSIYPPGWSLTLALGDAVGLASMVPPLVGALVLFFCYLTAREMYDSETGLIACGLLLLSPVFVLNATSYFAHTQVLCASFASVWCFLQARRATRSWAWPAAAGLALGIAAITRPVEGIELALGLALLERFLPRRRLPATLGLVPLAAALPVVVFLACNLSQSGSAFQTGYQAMWKVGPAAFFLTGTSLLGNLWNVQFALARTVMWQAPLLLAGLLAGALRDRGPSSRFIMSLIAITLLVRGAQGGLGGVEYGARYLFNAFGFSAILAARGLQMLLRERLAPAAVVAAVAFEVAFAAFGVFGGCLAAARTAHDGVSALDDWLSAATGPNALVFVKYAPDNYAAYYTRNLPDFSGGPRRVLFLEPERNEALRRSLSSLDAYVLSFDPAEGRFRLEPWGAGPPTADDYNAAAINHDASRLDTDAAEQTWRLALKKFPERWDLAYNLLRLECRLQHDDEALALAGELEKRQPAMADVYWRKAQILARRGQRAEAERYARLALDRVPPASEDARRYAAWLRKLEGAER